MTVIAKQVLVVGITTVQVIWALLPGLTVAKAHLQIAVCTAISNIDSYIVIPIFFSCYSFTAKLDVLIIIDKSCKH